MTSDNGQQGQSLTDSVTGHGVSGSYTADDGLSVDTKHGTVTERIMAFDTPAHSSVAVSFSCTTKDGETLTKTVSARQVDSSNFVASFHTSAFNHQIDAHTCTVENILHTPTDHGSSPWSVAGTGVGVALGLSAIVAGIIRHRRRTRRAAVDRSAIDLARWDTAAADLEGLTERWLTYDRDLSALVARPAMRNYQRTATAEAAQAMIDAENIHDAGPRSSDDVERLVKAVSQFETALDVAEYDATVEAERGMSEHERDLLRSARAALGTILDGGATPPERHAAYRAVTSILKRLDVEVSPRVEMSVKGLIESSQVVAGELTGTAAASADAIVAGLPAIGDPNRATYIATRVRRAAETDERALVDLLRSASLTMTSPTNLGTGTATRMQHDRLVDLRGRLRQADVLVEDLAQRDDLDADVRLAASQRAGELTTTLVQAGQALLDLVAPSLA